MLAGIRQRALASTRRRVPFCFAQHEGLGTELVLDLDLRETLACRVIVVVGRLARELQRPLPHPVREIGDLCGQASERGGVPLNPHAEIAPKAFEGTTEALSAKGASRCHQLRSSDQNIHYYDAITEARRIADMDLRSWLR